MTKVEGVFPESLVNGIKTYFDTRDDNLDESLNYRLLQVPENLPPGIRDHATFVRATAFLMDNFATMEPAKKARIISYLTKQTEFSQSYDVVMGIEGYLEDMLVDLVMEDIRVNFGEDPELQLSAQHDPDDPSPIPGARHIIYKDTRDEKLKLAVVFPEATSLEIQTDENAKKEFFLNILTLAYVAYRKRRDANLLHKRAQHGDWRHGQGAFGFMTIDMKATNAILAIMNGEVDGKPVWDDWKNFS